MKFFQVLPLLQLAGVALASPAAPGGRTKTLVLEPASPPAQPANIPLYSLAANQVSVCENWHHTFKRGNSLGWCAGCKRLEKCGTLLTLEAAACLTAVTVWGPAAILGCLVQVAATDFADYCFQGVC